MLVEVERSGLRAAGLGASEKQAAGEAASACIQS